MLKLFNNLIILFIQVLSIKCYFIKIKSKSNGLSKKNSLLFGFGDAPREILHFSAKINHTCHILARDEDHIMSGLPYYKLTTTVKYTCFRGPSQSMACTSPHLYLFPYNYNWN